MKSYFFLFVSVFCILVAAAAYLYQNRENKVNQTLLAECSQSISLEEFEFIVSSKFPDFYVSLEPVGEQPLFDQEGNTVSTSLQFDNPVVIIYRVASFYQIDPRLLLALSETSTNALSEPRKNPEYPFTEVDESRDLLKFQIEFGVVAEQLSSLMKSSPKSSNESLLSFDRSILIQFLEQYYPPDDVNRKIEELYTFLEDNFEISEELCQSSN